MEFSGYQQTSSPWQYLLASPSLVAYHHFNPENYVHWTQTPDSHIYSADLPGVRKEEIRVEVEETRYLTIRTEAIDETTKPARSFMRKFRLPGMVDVNRISAGYEDGVLTVTVPRAFTSRRGLLVDLDSIPESLEVTARAA